MIQEINNFGNIQSIDSAFFRSSVISVGDQSTYSFQPELRGSMTSLIKDISFDKRII